MSLAALKGPAEVEAEVLMSRTAFHGAFLIVEGDTDSRFFRSRVEESECEIVVAGGKPSVIGAIDRLNARTFRGVLGVIDNDCDSVDGRHVPRANLIPISDARDLDAYLVWSPALDRVLIEYSDASKLTALGGVAGVRSRLSRLSTPFGSLRRWSLAQSRDIDFKKLSPRRFITSQWVFDPQNLYIEAATQLGMNVGALEQQVESLPNADPKLVCQGHDLLATLSIGLAKGGILGSSHPSADTLASALRVALEEVVWRSSVLAQDIVVWETNNSPFHILSS